MKKQLGKKTLSKKTLRKNTLRKKTFRRMIGGYDETPQGRDPYKYIDIVFNEDETNRIYNYFIQNKNYGVTPTSIRNVLFPQLIQSDENKTEIKNNSIYKIQEIMGIAYSGR